MLIGILFCLTLLMAIGWGTGIFLNWVMERADEKWHWTEKLSERKREKKRRKTELDLQRWLEKREQEKVEKGPSFWKLMGQRISSAHDRICPEIVFRKFE